MITPIETLLAVASVGGRLDIKDDKLQMLMLLDCPPTIKEAVRANKAGLLALLHANFLIVRSATLNATVFWTPDNANKDLLVAAGANPGMIYTADELAQLVNRRVTTAELPSIHAAKVAFNGRVSG